MHVCVCVCVRVFVRVCWEGGGCKCTFDHDEEQLNIEWRKAGRKNLGKVENELRLDQLEWRINNVLNVKNKKIKIPRKCKDAQAG